MSRSPLVSVITIFLDEERFLEEAVRSVLNQSYPHWELLLVDDGSTDRSASIARSFAERRPGKIRYIHHEERKNRGMSASRNLGVRHARGELVAILDGDDVWEPEKLAEQTDVLEAHPEVGMVYGRTRFWHGWTGRPEDSEEDFLSDIGVEPESVMFPPSMLRYFLKSCPYTCSVLVRRRLIEEVGGFEEAFTGMYEDQVFFAKVFAHAPVYVSGRCWDRYRQHEQSCCSVAIREGRFHPSDPSPTGYAFLRWLRGFLDEAGVTDARARRELDDMLGPYEHPVRHRVKMSGRRLRRRLARGMRSVQGALLTHG